jgi:hypothetical protein
LIKSVENSNQLLCNAAKDVLFQTKEFTREHQSIIRSKRRGGGELELTAEAKLFLTSRKVVEKAISKALTNLKGIPKIATSYTCGNYKFKFIYGI